MTSVIVFLIVIAIIVCVILHTNGINVFKKTFDFFSGIIKKGKKEKKPKEEKPKKEKSSLDDAIPVSKINKAETKKNSTKIMKNVEEDKKRADIAEKIDEDSKKAKGVPLGGGKVQKVTKEDFQKSEIVLPPSSNFSDKPFENYSKPKIEDDDFDFMKDFGGGNPFGAPKKSGSSVDDLDLDALLKELEEEAKGDMPGGSGDYNDDPFDMPKFDASFAPSSFPKKSFNPFEDDDLKNNFEDDLEDEDDSEEDFSFAPSFEPSYASGQSFVSQSVGDRYDAVFGNGSNPAKNKIAKEIIVGDVLSGPRARTNRLMRREWDRRTGV